MTVRGGAGLWRTLAGLIALLIASPGQADVMEIGGSSFSWVAGGSAEQLAPQTNVPETIIADSTAPVQWRDRVVELAAKYDLSPALLEALVWQESRWRSGAVSPVGARGLAQLMPGTARQMGVDPGDPNANLEGGARYLRQQLDSFGGDLEKALAAYNAGPGRVQRAGGIPRIAETQNYVAAILARLSSTPRR
jgi:soluble lytic murein transglycosylase-like protein